MSFDAKDLRAEAKVLSAMRVPSLPRSTARGQYAAGWQGGEQVGATSTRGHRALVDHGDLRAIRVDVDTRAGGRRPVLPAHGKRLGRRVTEIAVIFKQAPTCRSSRPRPRSRQQRARDPRPARRGRHDPLRLEGPRHPDGGARRHDGLRLRHAFTESSPEAYERLILDVLLGDPPLFPRHEEVEVCPADPRPVLAQWESGGTPRPYRSGTWVPPRPTRCSHVTEGRGGAR